MKRQIVSVCSVLVAVLFLSITVLELNAHARAGGSRSMGSRGTRSYSTPATPPSQAIPPRQQATPAPAPGTVPQQQQSGGFMRNMAGGLLGGIAGGMLGGMLFRSLGMAGGGMGGGGIGIFEIILLAGIGYLIYRFIKSRRAADSSTPYAQGGSVSPIAGEYSGGQPAGQDVETGLGYIRQMDPSFDEQRFNDQVMDIFFKIQGSWMNRDLSPVNGLLTDEMRRIFQEDLDRLIRDRQVNRLENIAVRNVEVSEAWQESGQDFITASIYANLLDYTTDDTSGAVVSGSKMEPVKFEEYWTFTRPVGNNPWRLSAINQK
jgi:predicted lipid-binding transport protein (Tim44 family)